MGKALVTLREKPGRGGIWPFPCGGGTDKGIGCIPVPEVEGWAGAIGGIGTGIDVGGSGGIIGGGIDAKKAGLYIGCGGLK